MPNTHSGRSRTSLPFPYIRYTTTARLTRQWSYKIQFNNHFLTVWLNWVTNRKLVLTLIWKLLDMAEISLKNILQITIRLRHASNPLQYCCVMQKMIQQPVSYCRLVLVTYWKLVLTLFLKWLYQTWLNSACKIKFPIPNLGQDVLLSYIHIAGHAKKPIQQPLPYCMAKQSNILKISVEIKFEVILLDMVEISLQIWLSMPQLGWNMLLIHFNFTVSCKIIINSHFLTL